MKIGILSDIHELAGKKTCNASSHLKVVPRVG